jgi:malate dehydrogenase (oxaloacetate-decarboxylating)
MTEDAIEYHRKAKGKIELKLRVSVDDIKSLSLAYTPGVAKVSEAIGKNPELSFEYTRRWNSIAIVSDGTRVLGLGNVGPEAAMPVMEGKALLFKRFGGVDAYPICVSEKDKDALVRLVAALEPTFGGINLEDIETPKCFEVETELRARMKIPVLHDDQHGTAVAVLAGMINALKVAGKKKQDVKVVVNGAGAAGIAIAKLLIKYGVREIVVLDSKGAICKNRSRLEAYKQEFSSLHPNMQCGTLSEVIKGADVLVSASVPGAVKKEHVASMQKNAIVFALCNPTPEISREDALAAGAMVYGSGRSDLPNQINNAIAFPGIFRGALDVRASTINEEMKIAAAEAIAGTVPESEMDADKVVPLPFDLRLAPRVAGAVAEAAVKSGIAKIKKSAKEEEEWAAKFIAGKVE